MRRLGYLLLFALLVAASVPAVQWLLPQVLPATQPRSVSDEWKLELSRDAAVSLAYEIDPGGVRFPLPPGTRRVKLVTHARFASIEQLRAQQLEDPARRWGYAVQITLRDRDGATVLQREHHFRSNVTEWLDDRGRRLTAVYLLDSSSTPSNGSLLHLDLSGLPPVASVELRRLSMAPEARAVWARVYAPERIPERRVATLWQRLHDGQKARLARGNVYSHELLLEQEKRNLLRQLWQPLAPRGARGVDFSVAELYVLREVDGDRVEPAIAPAGLTLGPERRATVPIPEAGGDFRFEFTVLDEAPGEAQAALLWHGPGVFDELQFEAGGDAPRFDWHGQLAGGLVELSSERALSLRVFSKGTPDVEITPQKLYARSYLATAADSVDFALAHEDGQATPLRLTLRSLVSTSQPAVRGAHYAFVDRRGELIAEGELAVDGEASAYDEAVSELAGTMVTNARDSYFMAPPRATGLRLRALGAGALLVSLSSRPPELPRLSRVPEDRFEHGLRGARVPAWFGMRPRDYERRILEHRSRLLAVQSRPPERVSALAGGDYQWQDYRPEGDWLARVLFTPRDADSPMREDALPSTFSPLPANRSQRRLFPRYHGQTVLRPTLVWLTRPGREVTLQVTVDDQPPQTLRGRGAFGQARLRPLASGRHRIRVDAPAGVRLYLNHVAPTRRRAQPPACAAPARATAIRVPARHAAPRVPHRAALPGRQRSAPGAAGDRGRGTARRGTDTDGTLAVQPPPRRCPRRRRRA